MGLVVVVVVEVVAGWAIFKLFLFKQLANAFCHLDFTKSFTCLCTFYFKEFYSSNLSYQTFV